MIRYAAIEDARQAATAWDGVASTVVHIGDRGNSVFSFATSSGERQILRFTDPDFRSLDEVIAELNFVNHVYRTGGSVAVSLPAHDGRFAFPMRCDSGELICSAVAFAPGEEVSDKSRWWNKELFREWGKNLAAIHKAALTHKAGPSEPRRWEWESELLIARAKQLIPAGDRASCEEFDEVIAKCQSLPKSPSTYGLIHADHAPANFRYDPKARRITSFDFGNCCYHWFVADLAISLSTVRRKTNRDEIREEIIRGYTEIKDLPDNLSELIDLFIRLRVVYVYLSRLHLWSHDPAPELAQELSVIRERVHARTGW